MIGFTYHTDFKLDNEEQLSHGITQGIELYGKEVGDIHYYFFDDEQLREINIEHLEHDTYTDIISFDYSVGNVVSGEICISVDRVKENAVNFNQNFTTELKRVLSHGVLHFLGYEDKTEKEKEEMRRNEEIFIKILKNK